MSRKRVLLLAFALAGLAARAVAAERDSEPEAAGALPARVAFHAQATVVEQANAAFRSPYRGANSLDPAARGRETADLTLYIGLQPWRGAEVWADGEVDQGFGLSDTLGVAGYPSGEAYKVGRATPYVQLHRLFVRQTLDLGGERETVAADLNQFAGRRSAQRLVFTLGKFSVTDVFDTNKYAHDPRGDFLNWAVIDAGVFDYAANAWGYTLGAAVELWADDWTGRFGVFDLSDVPNSERLDKRFSQHQTVVELERRFQVAGHAGALRATGFLSDGRMGRFADAVARAQANGEAADISSVRRRRRRGGVSLNLEQAVTDDLGVFARAGWANGGVEPYEFADIDRTFSAGASLDGRRWGRKDDTLGAAFAVNAISAVHQRYLAAGGLGILVGDGRLPHAGTEQIFETYYSLTVQGPLKLSLDGQIVRHPAYNRDRGPAPIVAARLHAQF